MIKMLHKQTNGYPENYRYVFDPEGLYGGNQLVPERDPGKYAHIVRSYFNCTDDDIAALLRRLSDEGCGYVALVNSIFLRYYGCEEEFRESFHYPMFTPEGRLNFNDLLVDLYCATDNHNELLFGIDSIDHLEDRRLKKGYGTTMESLDWRFELYMRKHRIPAKLITLADKTIDVEKNLPLGPVLVSIRPTTLYDIDGKVVKDVKGGHTMNVTGAAENGLIRVSSWGKEFYVKHGSYKGYEYYQQILFG